MLFVKFNYHVLSLFSRTMRLIMLFHVCLLPSTLRCYDLVYDLHNKLIIAHGLFIDIINTTSVIRILIANIYNGHVMH